MKNFPHQYNDLKKLRGTLETARDLHAVGRDTTDDGTFGYELAHRRLVTFRGVDYSGTAADVDKRIADRITEELTKPSGSQGARTGAREMRRTLRYLGWLEEGGTALTPAGDALLATAEGSDEERVLMQQGIASIRVVDANANSSHPVQILLRLIDDVALHSRNGMQVALEALDDTADEFRRVSAIAAMPEPQRVATLIGLGWTEPQIANAIKILPSFAEQSGLMTTDATGRYILTDAGRRAIGRVAVHTPAAPPAPPVPPAPPGAAGSTRASARRRSTSIATRDASEVGRARRLLGAERRATTPEEQAIAAQLLYERTERHQALVRAVAERCAGGEFHEDAAAYDLVVDRDAAEPLVLAEMKTIAGDSANQVRSAVGQLFYYEHFAVAEQFVDREVRKVVVVDGEVADGLAEFLQSLGIGLFGLIDDEIRPMNDLGNEIARDLF